MSYKFMVRYWIFCVVSSTAVILITRDRLIWWSPAVYMGILLLVLHINAKKEKRHSTRFTWWTYWVAIRRAGKKEYFEFCQHQSAFRGPNKWLRYMALGQALRTRRMMKLHKMLTGREYEIKEKL